MGMKYPSELKSKYSVNEKYNRQLIFIMGISPGQDQLSYFFTQILHSGGENFTKDSYHEKRRNEK